LRYAARTFRENPAFTCVAILTLALGIGATTTIFSLLYTTVLYPVPYSNAERLIIPEPTNTSPQGSVNGMPWSYPKFQDARSMTRSFESFAAFAAVAANLTDAGEPERVQGEYVSTTYFTLLEIQSLLGRAFFDDEDKTPNSPAITVISERLWRRKFASDPTIIGRIVRINRVPLTIIGVAPGFFRGETGAAELWFPMSMAPTLANVPASLTRRFSHWHYAAARLKSGVTVEQANDDLKDAFRRMEEANPSNPPGEANPYFMSGRITPLLDAKVDPTVRRSLVVLLGGVGFVLLITCLNLSNPY